MNRDKKVSKVSERKRKVVAEEVTWKRAEELFGAMKIR